ncbi:MAG TPA: DNA polymerase domain-containing protein [Anaerolineales bacterium]|nr:DNA polymerase domain-containing protein [Anaerolineales bacterium]
MVQTSRSPGALAEYAGWLLDIYADPQGGVVLWLLGEDGLRRCLRQPFPVTFYAAGPDLGLRALWRFLKAQPVPVSLGRAERRDLFCPQPLPVLSIQVNRADDQVRLFRQITESFPDLTYYDADVPLALRYAAVHHVFPLARCQVLVDGRGWVQSLLPLDTPWELDPEPPPLRTLSLEPNCDPAHARPTHLNLRFERYEYRLTLEPVRPLLVGLRAILQRHDPDLLLTAWGDTWLLPQLLKLSRQARIPLPLNRDPDKEVEQRPERTYFSYGQVIYQGQQIHLFGRWHIDGYNAILFHDYGVEGALEMARVTGLPVQTAARVSPGTGISSMQMLTALRQGVLIPWHKQQAEQPKTALDLLRADQGGLVYQPTVGLHTDVAEIDFISMYPSIMVHFNISPETVGSSRAISQAAPGLGPPGDPEQAPGLVPQTLAPLLQKRLALKTRLATLPRWHPARKSCKARASAHKWLLVTCFGYLGYKNARFGRIEAHEAVTAYGREALLRAKEAAEKLGYSVLHLYVDGIWVRRPGASTVPDFQPLLDAILERTGLPVALDGIYRWVAFLPSRQDARVPVANRYFGVFQDGSTKLRGIEVRRRDTPPFIAETQLLILEALVAASQAGPVEPPLPKILSLLRARLAALRGQRLPLQTLLVSQKLSRALDEYRTPSPVARAVAQLQAAGINVSPGEHVRFLFTRGEPGVHAWNLPEAPDPACLDVVRYSELLVRAAGAMLGPFGVSEALLRQWLFSNAAYAAPPGKLPPPRRADLPLLASRVRPTSEVASPAPAPAWETPVLLRQSLVEIYNG